MYDVKTADGKSVKISREQAREIHQQIEREYLYEDVKSVLELDYPIELDEMQEDKSLDDFIKTFIFLHFVQFYWTKCRKIKVLTISSTA